MSMASKERPWNDPVMGSIEVTSCSKELRDDSGVKMLIRTTTQYMVSHRGHNCISSALTILDSALIS